MSSSVGESYRIIWQYFSYNRDHFNPNQVTDTELVEEQCKNLIGKRKTRPRVSFTEEYDNLYSTKKKTTTTEPKKGELLVTTKSSNSKIVVKSDSKKSKAKNTFQTRESSKQPQQQTQTEHTTAPKKRNTKKSEPKKIELAVTGSEFEEVKEKKTYKARSVKKQTVRRKEDSKLNESPLSSSDGITAAEEKIEIKQNTLISSPVHVDTLELSNAIVDENPMQIKPKAPTKNMSDLLQKIKQKASTPTSAGTPKQTSKPDDESKNNNNSNNNSEPLTTKIAISSDTANNNSSNLTPTMKERSSSWLLYDDNEDEDDRAFITRSLSAASYLVVSSAHSNNSSSKTTTSASSTKGDGTQPPQDEYDELLVVF